MTSPSGILLAAAGVSAGILLALPAAACVGLGAVAWAGRVAASVPRDPSAERIDPFTLSDPWRRYVQESLSARKTFDEAVKRAPSGPLRDRLREIGDRLDTGTRETWRIARHAQALMEARRSVNVDRISYELNQLGGPTASWEPGSPTAQTYDALHAQLATAQRMDQTLTDAETRLRLLDARLDEAVTRAIELSVQAHDLTDLAGLEGEVDSVVSDMEALRVALREADDAEHAGPTAGLTSSEPPSARPAANPPTPGLPTTTMPPPPPPPDHRRPSGPS
jgi:hypothetical protein